MADILTHHAVIFRDCTPDILADVLEKTLSKDVREGQRAVFRYVIDYYMGKKLYEEAIAYDEDQDGYIEAYVGDLGRKEYVDCVATLKETSASERGQILQLIGRMLGALKQGQTYYARASRADGDPERMWNYWGDEIERCEMVVHQFYWNIAGIQKAVSTCNGNSSLKALMKMCGSDERDARELRQAFFEGNNALINSVVECTRYSDVKTILVNNNFSMIEDRNHLDHNNQSIQHIWYQSFSYQQEEDVISINLVVRIKKCGEMTIAFTSGDPANLATPALVTEFSKIAAIELGTAGRRLFLVPAFPHKIYTASGFVVQEPRNPLLINGWDNSKGPYELGRAHNKIDTANWP